MRPGSQIQQDRNFETWSQMDCPRPNRGNILLRQTYVQHANKLHVSSDTLVMVEEELSELHVLGNACHRVESTNALAHFVWFWSILVVVRLEVWGSKNQDATYRFFEPERQFVERLVENVGEGHNVLYSMNVTGWAAKFINNIVISKFANDCPGVLRVCPLA